MATHSSILAWRILWTESLVCSMGLQRVDMTERLTLSRLFMRQTWGGYFWLVGLQVIFVHFCLFFSQNFCNKYKSVQFSSVSQSCPILCYPMSHSAPGLLSISNSQSPPKPMSIESVMPSSHLILCRPLLLLPSIFPSIWVFSNESALHIRWPKYQSFSFSISLSNEHPGLISFRMDWLDLLAVQGTLKSLRQHHSLKASILWPSAFFTVQL